MPGNFREIRRRIKGVTNTRQITKTMEMVAASRMRKAQVLALQLRAYAEKAYEILHSIAGKTGKFTHPLLDKRKIKHTTVIMITSDRGLCGGLNTNVISKVHEHFKDMPKESVSFITMGKKGRDMIMRLGYKVIADFSGMKRHEFTDISPMISMALEEFTSCKTDNIFIAYPQFVNTITQRPIVRSLLPLSQENFLNIIRDVAGEEEMEEYRHRSYEYKYEPDASEILTTLLPRLTEMQIYKSVLETDASEHSARMSAMRNATDAAEEIIEELTLSYNQARQASITREIAEISSAADALKET
jgi:F-type H+-transporting ATPase subunit gamma